MKNLRKNNRKISIHITLIPQNIDSINETIAYCSNFSEEIIVSSVYKTNDSFIAHEEYHNKVAMFFKNNLYNKKIILVGFEPFCTSANCLDGQNIYMITKDGNNVKCYWRENRGQFVKSFIQ